VTGLIGKRRYSPPTAALANGAAAHALDFDDQHDPASRANCRAAACSQRLKTSAISAAGISCSRMRSAPRLHARLGLACYNSLGKAGTRR
jgi:hypothetical protein